MHGLAIIKTSFELDNRHTMAPESTTSKDTLRFEKLTLLFLALCLVALVGLQVFRFF
jgi:hypothetical protein